MSALQDYVGWAFDLIGKVREAFGLPVEESAPDWDVKGCDEKNVGGFYNFVRHTIWLSDDADFNILFHECCHAHQRSELFDDAYVEYKMNTPYHERWSEIEANKIAFLTCLLLKGLDVKEGDLERIYVVPDPRTMKVGRFSRSLRKRINKMKGGIA